MNNNERMEIEYKLRKLTDILYKLDAKLSTTNYELFGEGVEYSTYDKSESSDGIITNINLKLSELLWLSNEMMFRTQTINDRIAEEMTEEE